MASIKRSELDYLKLQANSADCYQQLWDETELELDAAYDAIEEWKVRTWTAEQEIHDLKEQAERDANRITALEYSEKVYRDECIELIDEYVDECSQHDKLKDKTVQQEASYENLYESFNSRGLTLAGVVEQLDDLKKKYFNLLGEVTVAKIEIDKTPVRLPAETSWSAETYYSTHAPRLTDEQYIQSQTKRTNPVKKHFSRIAISLLLLAMLGLGLVSYRQNQVIQYQRHVLVEAAQYILQNCTPSSLSQAQR